MPKACLNCGTDNRDEALFCRRCGTPFSSDHASPSTAEPTLPGDRPPPSDGPVPPRTASALPPVAVPTPDLGAPPASVFDADDEDVDDERTVMSGSTGFPAASGPRDEEPKTVVSTPQPPARADARPLPGAPAQAATAASVATAASQIEKDVGTVPTTPGTATPGAATPGAATAGTTTAATAPPGGAARPASRPAVASQLNGGMPIGRWLAFAAGALLLIGLGYWFLSARTARPSDETSAAPASVPAASAPVDNAPVAAEAVPASAAMTPPPSLPASAAELPVPVDSAPAASAPASSASSADEAKAARDKLDRAARAKALREQAASAAAAKKADQDIAAQRAAQERARAAAAEPAPSAPPPAPAPAAISSPAPRTAQEACAGKGTIGTAICLSRECGRPEHVDEARCRQVNAAEEERRR